MSARREEWSTLRVRTGVGGNESLLIDIVQDKVQDIVQDKVQDIVQDKVQDIGQSADDVALCFSGDHETTWSSFWPSLQAEIKGSVFASNIVQVDFISLRIFHHSSWRGTRGVRCSGWSFWVYKVWRGRAPIRSPRSVRIFIFVRGEFFRIFPPRWDIQLGHPV